MQFIENLVRQTIQYRKSTLTLCFVACLAIIYGISNLDFGVSYKKFISPKSEYLKADYEIQNSYGQRNNILIMVQPKDGRVFSREALSFVKEFTEQAWQLPYSKRVDSITNFQYTQVEGDDLTVDDLVADEIESLSDPELEQLKTIALDQIELVNLLLASDASATGINVEFSIDDEDPRQVIETKSAVDALIAELEDKYPNIQTYTTGQVDILYAWAAAAGFDFAIVFPIALLAIFIGMIWFFGSVSATLMAATITTLSVLGGVGVIGHFGGLLVPLTCSGLIMILILAVADSVHVLSTAGKMIELGYERNDAIVAAVVRNFRAIALTSITTSIGFLSFNFSQFDAIKWLGNMVAAGVILAFILSVILLPALLSYCAIKESKQRIKPIFYTNLANVVLTHRKWLLLATGPLVLVSIWLAQLNEIDDGMAKFLAERVEFRQDLKVIEDELTGSTSLLYNLDTDQAGVVNTPEYMKNVDAIAAWFRQQEEVRFVSSYTDTMRRLNRDMNFGDPAFQRLPNDQALAAQYLLLYEMSLPFGLDLTNRINLDKSGSLLTVTTNDMSVKEYQALNDRALKWMQSNTPSLATSATGAVYIMISVTAINFIEMLQGAMLALGIIGIILIFSLRSINAGIICGIGVVGPILVAFAAWALVVGTVGLAAATVISMAIGIAVDDTVHFMSKYLHAIKDLNKTREDGIRYAYENVGEALLINTIALGTGFFIMAASNFSIYSVMGLLTAITIVLALLANITLVPALLMVRFSRENRFFIKL